MRRMDEEDLNNEQVEVDGLGRMPKEINKKIKYCPMCGIKLDER